MVECLIQRNWGYATKDVRVCYAIIKQKLYNPQYSKVVFILHSQGGIEGSLILDWLLQELPQDLLSKLEVYTFGNAANHFNNPHRHISSQTLAKQNPLAASIDSTQLARGHGHTTVPHLNNSPNNHQPSLFPNPKHNKQHHLPPPLLPLRPRDRSHRTLRPHDRLCRALGGAALRHVLAQLALHPALHRSRLRPD